RSEAQLVRLAKAAGIRVTGLSSFYAGDPLPPSDPVIVLGYAGLSPESLAPAISALARAWAKP
ncbi:MAG: PLP-dependent aminotransferase family protein, partial [Eubacteriaceae bacterium]|nr:PLP-dependent aminotransferase family protein [Eubacteriaceae bacterium]